jgi:hypothetical protein
LSVVCVGVGVCVCVCDGDASTGADDPAAGSSARAPEVAKNAALAAAKTNVCFMDATLYTVEVSRSTASAADDEGSKAAAGECRTDRFTCYLTKMAVVTAPMRADCLS